MILVEGVLRGYGTQSSEASTIMRSLLLCGTDTLLHLDASFELCVHTKGTG
jgi:hypothetical protein